MSQNFREELIASVNPEGRELYKRTIDAIPEVIGNEAQLSAINIRIIKGAQLTSLKQAMLTTTGLATADGIIVDCGAAMVQKKDGIWQRYSGKDTPHSTRLLTSYDLHSKQFNVASTSDDGSIVISSEFPASLLLPRDGQNIMAKFGECMLEGVLEDGELTDHIRFCLSSFEKKVEDIGILLRHRGFQRSSDTRNPPVRGINTLYSDGSQIHVMNRRTVLDWQNAHMKGRQMPMASYRAGLELDAADRDGQGMPPNIEDLIYETHIQTRNDGDVPLYFTALTPRCQVTQRDLITGKINAEPKLWNRKHRPLLPDSALATMGANADIRPESDGAIIQVGDRLTVVSEKTAWHQ